MSERRVVEAKRKINKEVSIENRIFQKLKKLALRGINKGTMSIGVFKFEYTVSYPGVFLEGEEFKKAFDKIRLKYAEEGNVDLFCLNTCDDNREDIFLAYDVAGATELQKLKVEDYKRELFENDIFCVCYSDWFESPVWLDEGWIHIDKDDSDGLYNAFNKGVMRTINIFLGKMKDIETTSVTDTDNTSTTYIGNIEKLISDLKNTTDINKSKAISLNITKIIIDELYGNDNI